MAGEAVGLALSEAVVSVGPGSSEAVVVGVGVQQMGQRFR